MFFINMKIAHRRKVRAMEKSDLDEEDESITASNIQNKRFSLFRKKKKVDSVGVIRSKTSRFNTK